MKSHVILILAALRVSLEGTQSAAAQLTVLTITNPTPAAFDSFGESMAPAGLGGSVIGDSGDDTGALNAGAAYLFSSNGTLLTTFTNPTPAMNDGFGRSVAGVGTDKIVIGAFLDDTGGTDVGAVYLFSTNGMLLLTLTNPFPATSDRFGISVAAVNTETILIGTSPASTVPHFAGVAYLFSTNGTLLRTFNNPTPAPGDRFGLSVAPLGSTHVLIGANGDDTGASDAGAAYLFNLSGALLTSFTNPAPAPDDAFGRSLAAMGADNVLIGAPSEDSGAVNAGAAYLFSTNGTLLTTFTNPSVADGGSFGIAVSGVGADKVLIGAIHDGPNGPGRGTAYLFALNGTLLLTLTNPAPPSQYFGASVAEVGADKVLVGGAYPNDAGAAYLFCLPAFSLLSAVASNNLNVITLTFSEVLRPDGATNRTNYTVTQEGGGTLAVHRASLLTPSTVQLMTDTRALTASYVVTVSVGVTDDSAAMNPILPPNNERLLVQEVLLLAWNATWAYNDFAILDGVRWFATDYNASTWSNGPGLFGHEPGGTGLDALVAAGLSIRTSFSNTVTSSSQRDIYYFRSQVIPWPFDVAGVTFQFRHFTDDGIITYVNGVEQFRFNMPTNAAIYSTNGAVNGIEGTVQSTSITLNTGDNLLAVELHQPGPSSDVAFGAELIAIAPSFRPPRPPLLNISRTNGSVTLSWDTTATGFVLEFTESLTFSNWQPVPNGTNGASLPLTEEARFFRLKK